jgi:NADH:ubiquinone oxidoreductase subunit 5 (subunit L)/multisubunit Na+/H+ antiporter MnhA subunit
MLSKKSNPVLYSCDFSEGREMRPNYKALCRTALAFLVPTVAGLLINPSVIFFGNQSSKEQAIDIKIIIIVCGGQIFFFIALLVLARNTFFPTDQGKDKKTENE